MKCLRLRACRLWPTAPKLQVLGSWGRVAGVFRGCSRNITEEVVLRMVLVASFRRAYAVEEIGMLTEVFRPSGS